MSVPPNAGPPKTLVFRYPALEQKLREQFVYQAYASAADVAAQRFVPGNRLVLKFKDEVMGEGQVILCERVSLATLTPYDAIIAGYENVDALRNDCQKSIVGDARKPEEVEFYRILYRWL